MNARLQDAVEIFKTLGWANATAENMLDLPLGDREQQKIALSGLKSGDWGEFANLGNNHYGWRSFIDVDKNKLAFFAIRLGIDARRAVSVLGSGFKDVEGLIRVVADRGPRYAEALIKSGCVSRRRMSEHSVSAYGNVAVRLVDRMDLLVPENIEYLKDWSVYAAAALGMRAEIRSGEEVLPDQEVIRRRFGEHILMGVAVNTPATGPFGTVLPAGVQRGWLARETAIELTFSALDASVRPGDRKVWLTVLDELEITEMELMAHAQALIPLLALGETVIIQRLAPVLIAQVEEELLVEVLLSCFSAITKKARQLVLACALERKCPDEAQSLVPWLVIYLKDKDKKVVTLTKRLMEQWEIQLESEAVEAEEVHGLWQDTPAVWQIPDFKLAEISPQALTDLAATIARRPSHVHDVITEHFLAMANAVAYQDPEAARISLRGIRGGQTALKDYIFSWVKGEKPRFGFDKEGEKPFSVIYARNYIVSVWLDKLPCLLSTPSVVDLSINVSDLVKRLAIYQKTGTAVLEADLFLALTRLNVTTGTPVLEAELKCLDVPIILQSGEHMGITAGTAALKYLCRPVKEPPRQINKYGYWGSMTINTAGSLDDFPDRFARQSAGDVFAVFPLWGDVALRAISWSDEVNHELGLILRQAVRRATPLPPGGAMNLLAAQRSMAPDAAEDSRLAVMEAWERGLLRPGAADTDLLDWRGTSPPTHLVSLAAALEGIAGDGMLTVVWPILDEIVVRSLKAPRLLNGTVEIVELILSLLPEVKAAVKQQQAEPNVLDLPGIRALAKRGGASRAVTVADQIVKLLPQQEISSAGKGCEPSTVLEPAFEAIWPEPKVISILNDGGSITIDTITRGATKQFFVFNLRLPGISDRKYQILNSGWYYDLQSEGQCRAYAVTPEVTGFGGNRENEVWLHWDSRENKMVVCEWRNWYEQKRESLRGVPKTPLSFSLQTVIIGLLAQDGDARYYAPRLLRQFIESEEINSEVICRAMQILLEFHSILSPAKLVRELEKDLKLLPILWPMLTESIKTAGSMVAVGEAPPVWINRVLDISLRYSGYLIEAVKREWISAENAKWTGLPEIAAAKSKSAAVTKAKKLLAQLQNNS